MSSKVVSCSCQNAGVTAAVAENVTIENPFKSKSASNFEIMRYKPSKERLLDNSKYPTLTYKHIEDIKETLLESCNFEQIKEVLYYLERNPDIYDVVPDLLEFISRELKKEDQQRAPILLKALYCLYTNSVFTVSDFSVCTNALEHFLTKSSTFPGDYVLKDIAADILSDFCAMSPSDDLKEHFILQLSRVFHNPNWHSYNLYGGIVGCLSNMSVKSGPEVVPYDEFHSNTFLRHVLSTPKMLRKLFYLCKPFIYSCLPSKLIPMPLHNENSFYDINTSCAGVFNLMRNEMLSPISYVNYDRRFSTHYRFNGGWFDDAKWSNLPADCLEKDLIWPGFSDYQREKMLEKNTGSDAEIEKISQTGAMSEGSINSNESERNLEMDSMSKGSITSNESLQNSQIDSKSNDYIKNNKSVQNSQTDCKSDGYLYFNRRESSLRSGHKSDGYIQNFKKKYLDFDRSDYTKMWLDKYGDNGKHNESEMNPSIDRESDGCLDFNWRASSSRHGLNSDGYVNTYKKRKYSDFNRKSDYTKRWMDKYGGNAKGKRKIEPLIDRVSDGCVRDNDEVNIPRGLRKQNIQSDFSESDTDGSKNEENLQIKNVRKLRTLHQRRHKISRKKIDVKRLCKQDVQSDFFKGNTDGSNGDENFQIRNEWNLRRLQVSLKKIDWKFDDNMDITEPQVESKDSGDVSHCEEKKKFSESDSNVKTCESERISQIGNRRGGDSSKNDENEDDFQINFESKSDKDNSKRELNNLIKNDGTLNSCKNEGNSLTGTLKGDMKSSESFLSLPLISPGRLGNFQTADKSKRDINSSESEKNLQTENNSDLNSSKTESNSYIDCKSNDMDIDEVKNLQDENKSSGVVKNSEGESNLQIDSKSDDHTDITDCERNLQDKNKSIDVKNSDNDRNLQIDSKFDGATDITDCIKNLQDDNKSNEDVKNGKSGMDLPFYIIYDSAVDGITDCERNLQVNSKPVDPECSSRVIPGSILEYKLGINSGTDADIADSKRNSQADCRSTGDMDIYSERNLQADRKPGLNDWKRPLQYYTKPSEHIEFKTNEERTINVDSRKAKMCDDRAKTKSPESPGFRTRKEYSEYLAWKREKSYSDSHKWNEIGETLQIISPPSHIDRSVFEHHQDDDFVPDIHVISSEYLSEESVTVGQNCCERANVCANPSVVCSSQPDLDIFKNLDKNIFANWEFKKQKAAKKESPGAEKSEARSPFQKKCKTRGGRKR